MQRKLSVLFACKQFCLLANESSLGKLETAFIIGFEERISADESSRDQLRLPVQLAQTQNRGKSV